MIPWCDILCFNLIKGHHIRRLQLSGGAGIPGNNNDILMVPIDETPVIEIYNFQGHHIRSLCAEDLNIPHDAWGLQVSPIVDDIFHYLIASPKHQIHTYQVRRSNNMRWFPYKSLKVILKNILINYHFLKTYRNARLIII